MSCPVDPEAEQTVSHQVEIRSTILATTPGHRIYIVVRAQAVITRSIRNDCGVNSVESCVFRALAENILGYEYL